MRKAILLTACGYLFTTSAPLLPATPTTHRGSLFGRRGRSLSQMSVSVSKIGDQIAETVSGSYLPTDSNDAQPALPYGFWNWASSCNGSAPIVGAGTYPMRL